MTPTSFSERFPRRDDVIRRFAPRNWGRDMAHAQDSLMADAPSLNALDTEYGSGTASTLVVAQIYEICKISLVRTDMQTGMFDSAAGLFLARYGDTCNPYHMQLYFGGYLTDYKSTMAQFNTGDILASYRSKFEPWLNARLDRLRRDTPPPDDDPDGVKGVAAMAVALWRRARELERKDPPQTLMEASPLTHMALSSHAMTQTVIDGIQSGKYDERQLIGMFTKTF